MNKNKKIAVAVVSTVMAGTMVLSMAACNPTDTNKPTTTPSTGATIDQAAITKLVNQMTTWKSQTRENTNATGWTTAKSYWNYLSTASSSAVSDGYGVLNSDGTINYSAYTRSNPVTLNIAIGHNGTAVSTSFQKLGDTITLPDGKNYDANSMKPAWAQMGADLNITWNDVYEGKATNANMAHIVSGQAATSYADTDMFTTDLSIAVEYAASGTSVLNLADYLDYMPNFKSFLEQNPIVYLSLLQDGMSTTDGSGKTLYVAPYFDGNDDIERYCIVRQDWVEKLLNGDNAISDSSTFKAACASTVSAGAYMGTTGKTGIESTNAQGTGKTTIYKNYSAALEAAKDSTTALGAAYNAITNNTAYAVESGNIVDIMNTALAANNEATGAQLVALFRAYIDVCYQNADGTSYYSSSTRANLFNGYDACWDVDDLVAMLRCVKTNAATLVASGQSIEGIVPRSGQNDRTPDMVRLAAQLYGVRGADSRYEYTYIDNSGTLQDARNDAEFYEAMARLNLLKQEGLVADYSGISSFSFAAGLSGTKEAFMMYDYSQTQTKNDYYAENSDLGTEVPEGFYFSPIVTPVSKWDVDGDSNHTDIMRFTESWRSTKTSGLALNGGLANAGNEEKLKAALQFVDYLYSEDGQIVSTYGPMASSANGTGGFWYNAQATSAEISAGNYFTYKGVKYSGTSYKGKTTPTVTDALYQSFLGKTVNGWSVKDNDNTKAGALSFTDYARRVIGSTLPVGVKDQSFENQLTATSGRTGANRVGVGLALGTIKGLTLEINQNNWWYTCVPTGLPVSSSLVANVLNASDMDNLKYATGTQKDDKNFLSIFNYIILNGLSGTYNQQDVTYTF